MPQNSNFRLPRRHRFRPKLDFTVMASNQGGDTLGSILGPMRSHWGQKMGENCKKLPCPKIRTFDYPAVIDFDRNWTLRLWRQITVGTPHGPSWGQWGPIGAKIWVKTAKNYHVPKFEFSTKIWALRLWRQITVGTYRVNLGSNGLPLGKKNGSKP